jgi:threonine/homoserine/homoserine lactone efflux protein
LHTGPGFVCYESAVPDPALFGLFVLAAIALLIVPGPSVLYVVSQSVEGGPRAGLTSTLGIHLGTLVHVTAATIGLSSLLVSSARAYDAVKFAGAAYLIFLGIRALLGRSGSEPQALEVEARRRLTRGATVQILNPKTALFFFAFLPQFVDTKAGSTGLQIFVLGLTFTVLGLISDGTYALAAGALAGRLRTSRGAAVLSRWAPGTVLVGLGVVAALAGPRRSR